ncbi:calpain-7-like [Arctopsyche grandis]|uniref:calpain-7-like n=1 Tax=Arctopsyche grandis TaxID=121162 RepID=UPI00406D699F
MSELQEGIRFAKMATDYDSNGNIQRAIEFYNFAANLLENAALNMSLDSTISCNAKVEEYRARALQLAKQGMESQDPEERKLRRCYFLFEQALDADNAQLKDIAVDLYAQAVELGISVKCSGQTKQKLTSVLKEALERAENLKGISKPEKPPQTTQDPEDEDELSDLKNLSLNSEPGKSSTTPTVSVKSTPRSNLHRGNSAHLKVAPGQDMYTKEEKYVLSQTSQINNNQFVPFMSIDLSEKYRYALPFSDKDGLLVLSRKQKSDFDRWARPEEISSDPKLIIGPHVDCFSIKQTVVSDCSFVASLAVAALYEKRFQKRLVTSIIYPKKTSGEPVINPFGKYMIKLHLNGVPRKVIIDDLLPVGRYNQLLCSYSSNKNEFWISLLEKAYMKVMGGYDFPGSNSNIDLHALTGWIPERCAIRRDTPDFNSNALFDLIMNNLNKGCLLATVATGELSDAENERTGLVPTHAYAVLDVKIVDNTKLFQLKNPWSHLRWKGNYSELDHVHWTPTLKSHLNYDPKTAALYDNGVFWIDYESILHFFDVFYINWNPEIFAHTYCIHQLWNADSGPIKDAYNVGDNPQFSLNVQGQGDVWILLTRHITQIEDFRENNEYITVLVYKNEGRRIYYPHDPPPYIDGVRINSPHYLCKINVGAKSASRYTLVVSQYEKMRTIFYTLRAYGTCPFTLKKLHNFPVCEQVTGEWKDKLAGGCANYPTNNQNPKYLVTLGDCPSANHMVLDLRGPKDYQINIDVAVQSLDDPDVTAPFITRSSGPYRSGFVVLELADLPSGKYKVTVSTFYPMQEGPYILTIKSTAPIKISKIQ